MGQRSRLFYVKRLLILSVTLNLALAIGGFIISYISSSNALLADAFDSIFNAVISLIVLFGITTSVKLTYRNRNLNYLKIEILSAFTVAVLAIPLAGFLIYSSLERFYTGYSLNHAEIALTFSIIFGIASSILTVQKYRYAKKFGLLSLKADSLNSIKDALSSFVASIGIFLSMNSSIFFDSLSAIVIALFLASAFLPVIRESSMILVDAFNDPTLRNKIEEFAKDLPYINRVLSVNCRRVGYRLSIEIELEVDGDISVENLHEVLKKYEERIKNGLANVAKVLIVVKQVS
ncbi:MAG TPA: cation diffusion facilitator family transporter [Geobacterales bacterium]|nr:cation diffusion facilitator family transporter [Geobacterales bacterium]